MNLQTRTAMQEQITVVCTLFAKYDFSSYLRSSSLLSNSTVNFNKLSHVIHVIHVIQAPDVCHPRT